MVSSERSIVQAATPIRTEECLIDTMPEDATLRQLKKKIHSTIKNLDASKKQAGVKRKKTDQTLSNIEDIAGVTSSSTSAAKNLRPEASPKKRSKKQLSKYSPETSQRKSRATHSKYDYKKSKIRGSPRRLLEALSKVNSAQMDWLKLNGFEKLSHFKFTNLAHRIGYYVINNYNANDNIVTLENGDELPVTEEEVQRILGLPRGDREIVIPTKMKKKENDESKEMKLAEIKKKNADREKNWRSQFDNDEEVEFPWKVSPTIVTQKINNSTEVDDFFMMNFVILITNVLIAPHTTSFVRQDLLRSNVNFNECAEYNWCAYLIKELKRARSEWKEDAFFTGSLAFLVFLYLDRVDQVGSIVVRKCSPAFKAWTTETVEERELYEMEKNLIGMGTTRLITIKEEEEEEKEGEEEEEQQQHHSGQPEQYQQQEEESAHINQFAMCAEDVKRAVAGYQQMKVMCHATSHNNQRVLDISNEMTEFFWNTLFRKNN